MAFVINDRVKETTTTTGTGTLSLGGAVTGFETFSSGIGNSNTTYYAITLPGSTEFEVGLGTLNSDSSTIARTTIISSSNSDSAVDFSAGTKTIFCTIPASKSVLLSDVGGSTLDLSSANIHAGRYGSSSSPVNISVTVASKSAHPYQGDGSSAAYYLNGIEAPALTFHGADNVTSDSGYYYKFDQSDSSNGGHPLRFYLDADKTTAFTSGVTTNGTAGSSGAYTQIDVDEDTPNILYYQCSNHGYMGNYAITLGSNKINHTEALISFPTATGTLVGTGDTGSVTNAMLAQITTAGKVALGALEIDGASDIGEDLVDADLIIVDDGAGGTEVKSTLTRVKKYIYSAMSGDATASDAGALTIANTSVETGMIANNAITATQLANDAVGADQLASSAVVTASVVDANITLAKIANQAANTVLVRDANSSGVVSAKALATTEILIGDGTGFTAAALSGDVTMANTGAVTIGATKVVNSMLADDAVGADELAANAVVTASIVDDNVTQAKIADDAVGADQLASNAVVNASVASGAAIAFSKMADLTASRALVSDGSGDVSVSAVTSTEIGYLDGVSSAIQTQLNAKTTATAAANEATALAIALG